MFKMKGFIQINVVDPIEVDYHDLRIEVPKEAFQRKGACIATDSDGGIYLYDNYNNTTFQEGEWANHFYMGTNPDQLFSLQLGRLRVDHVKNAGNSKLKLSELKRYEN